jgi:hypothetical protein
VNDLKEKPLISGHSLIELILVMLLLILFSMATISLVLGSADAYSETISNNDNSSNLRISQAYIHTKIRQNLEAGALSLRKEEGIDDVCLAIKESHLTISYETIIFVKEGFLRESLVIEGFEFDSESSFPVIRLDKIEFELIKDKGLAFKTTLIEDGSEKSLYGFVALP